MAIVHTRQKNGVVAVYDQKSTWDKVAKKSRTKRKYIGHLDKDGKFVPSSGKRGRPRKVKDISKPVKARKDAGYEVRIKYLEAEIRRLKDVLRRVKDFTQGIDNLIDPSLEEETLSE